MISLCVYDLIYMTASLLMFSLPLLYPNIILSLSFKYSVTFLLPIAQTAMTGQTKKTGGQWVFKNEHPCEEQFHLLRNKYDQQFSLKKSRHTIFFYRM